MPGLACMQLQRIVGYIAWLGGIHYCPLFFYSALWDRVHYRGYSNAHSTFEHSFWITYTLLSAHYREQGAVLDTTGFWHTQKWPLQSVNRINLDCMIEIVPSLTLLHWDVSSFVCVLETFSFYAECWWDLSQKNIELNINSIINTVPCKLNQ